MVFDDFNRVDGPVGPDWLLALGGDAAIVNQRVVKGAAGPGFMWFNAAFAPEQSAELRHISGSLVGPAVRVAVNHSVVFTNDGRITKYIAGSPTNLQVFTPFTNGTGRLSVVGTTYSAWVNNVLVGTVEITDPVLASGAAGFYVSGTGIGDDWRATQYQGDSMANVTDTFYPSEGFIGYGAQWLIGQGNSPETFVSVAQVDTIEFGEMTAGIVNKTHLRSPGRAHEKIATLRDLGPFRMTGTLNLKHGSMSNAGGDGFTSGGLIALHRNLEERNMKLILPDGSPGTELPFRGVISKLKLGTVGLEELVKYEAEVQPLQDYTAALP